MRPDELAQRRTAARSLADDSGGSAPSRPTTLRALAERRGAAADALEQAWSAVTALARTLDPADPAAVDRLEAAIDRHDAARDRLDAAVDRLRTAAMLKRSHRDGLTGALLRDAGATHLQQELDRSQREGTALVLAFLDVDGLKTINDTRGHAAGDEALRAVGRALAQCLRSYDVIVRFGGDEFVCALPGLTRQEADARFDEVLSTLGQSCPGTTFSVGHSVAAAEDTVEQVLARADADLYRRRRRRSADDAAHDGGGSRTQHAVLTPASESEREDRPG